jgi:hypothetical protein
MRMRMWRRMSGKIRMRMRMRRRMSMRMSGRYTLVLGLCPHKPIYLNAFDPGFDM